MHWWIMVQLGQWLTRLTGPSVDYLVSDDVFFSQPRSQQLLTIDHPDTLLLDAALFQATNEARRVAHLLPLQHDRDLYQAARRQATSMIEHDYVSHENRYDLSERTLLNRVQKQTNRFSRMAENIGQYQTVDTPDWYGVRFNARSQRYDYVDVQTQQRCNLHTYASYARYAVAQWLHSAHHRANLLDPLFTHVGCAVRLSTSPFQERRAPFGRLVQDFGGVHVSDSR